MGAERAADISGTWQLTAQSSIFNLAASLAGQIKQRGSHLSGNLAISGTPCATAQGLAAQFPTLEY